MPFRGLHGVQSSAGIEHVQRSKRHQTIIAAVRGGHEVRAAELARSTGASAMTIRRDLSELESRGVLRRTHGGAVGLPSRGAYLPYAVRAESGTAQKRAIGSAAAELIPDGSSVIIDDGTTCAAAAEELAGRSITVLALSVHIAAALGGPVGTRILTPGGELDPEELSWSGHRAVREVESFRADVALLGVCGWEEQGGMTASTVQDADIKRAILGSARTSVALATAEKIGSSATFAVAQTDQVHTLVTDALPAGHRAWLQAAGVEVMETS